MDCMDISLIQLHHIQLTDAAAAEQEGHIDDEDDYASLHAVEKQSTWL